MNNQEFLINFSQIENHLFSIVPTFDKKLGFFKLLKYFQSNNLMPDDLLRDFYEVYQVRNKIVNSQSRETALTLEIVNKIQKIKQSLNI